MLKNFINLYHFTGSSYLHQVPRPYFDIPPGSTIHIHISFNYFLRGVLLEIEPDLEDRRVHALLILNTGTTFTAYFPTDNNSIFNPTENHECYIRRPNQGALEALLRPHRQDLDGVSRIELVVPRGNATFLGALQDAHDPPAWHA